MHVWVHVHDDSLGTSVSDELGPGFSSEVRIGLGVWVRLIGEPSPLPSAPPSPSSSAPLAVYLRIASRESRGPSSRWKAPRSIRTCVWVWVWGVRVKCEERRGSGEGEGER